MPDQSEISYRRERALSQDFELIETMRWTRASGFYLLDEHIERLRASALALKFRFAAEPMWEALEHAIADFSAPVARLRLTLARDGRFCAAATPIELPGIGTRWRVIIASTRLDSADPLLRHKTTRRAVYEEPLAVAQREQGADEVIFCNERAEICEGARSSFFLADGAHLLTPTLACGLLPGVLRAHLLASGRAREAVLRPADLSAQSELYMGNSVRGLVAADLLSPMREGTG